MKDTRTPVSKVRLTASQSGNALWRRVRRISVATGLGLAGLLAAFARPTNAAETDSWTIRIVPRSKWVAPLLVAPPRPMMDQMLAQNGPPTAPRAAAPPMQTPPRNGATGPRIIPSRRGFGHPGPPTFADIFRSIPFSRAEYEANPSYRSEAAMAILQMVYSAPYQPGPPPGGEMKPGAPVPKPAL